MLKTKIQKFQTKNAKGVLSLLAGNTFAQMIMVAGGFVLGRWYGPEFTGTYNVFLSFVAILSILCSFRLENIFVLSKSPREIRNLFSSLLVLSTISITLFFLGYAVFEHIIPLGTSLWIVFLSSLGALFSAWMNIQTSLFTKYKLFEKISKGFVINALSTVFLQFVFYGLGYKSNGLIYGTLIGTIITCFYFFRITKGRIVLPDWQKSKKTIHENREIVRFTLPSESLNVVANNMMNILLAFYFSKTDVGLFAMSAKVLVTPLVLLSNSMSKVFFQKSAQLVHAKAHQLYRFSWQVVRYNVFAISVFLVLMNTIGVFLLDWILGPEWQGLQKLVRILSFWILCRSALNPIQSVVMVIKKNHYALIFNIYLVLVTFFAVFVGGSRNELTTSLILYSFLAGLGYLIQLFFVMKALKKISSKKTP
ncbi:colanic acid exporter [Weeksella virosa]|uniref:lipopolysaccharide biosynthesis protein n=1 Tax=Weeksella virosa TaxID=1014 RepID=UPI000E045254|nr:oligosaccharide flippase family protein [Weeksella virosa]SUP53855.1 colanic acid exporter [Weeksella virosa]